ncbi:hypothetical protein lerEdw1_011558 [Lerista edwardsae]|nr:hypothetical protein lerEdw1_011558 [Lerista edwardsae]
MGVLLLLALMLQTLIGNISSAIIIHEDEHGNPVLTFNDTDFEELFPDYVYNINSTDIYGYYDYSLFESATTKATPIGSHGVHTTNLASALLLGCLSIFLLLHLLQQGASL